MSAPSGTFGARILELADRLATHSDLPGALSCTYLTPAHRASAKELAQWMQAAGMMVSIDGVGNVVGRYQAAQATDRSLIVGSHYDTVVDAGKYDGRLGILTGIVVIDHLNRSGRRLPFAVELIAFAEEEGLRFSASYIGSTAVAGLIRSRPAGASGSGRHFAGRRDFGDRLRSRADPDACARP